MVFKKDITPLSKRGSVKVHKGKGSTTQRPARGERESVTGGDPLGRAQNRYPPVPPPPVAPTSAPPMGGPPLGSAPPPAPMPGSLPDEE